MKTVEFFQKFNMDVQAHTKYIRLQPNSIMSNQRISAHCCCITGENERSSETADILKKVDLPLHSNSIVSSAEDKPAKCKQSTQQQS